MTPCPKPGIYPGVPFAEYCRWDAIHASFLTTLARRTPYHAWHDRQFPRPETDALRIGRALHSYLLEPATFQQFWAVCPACDKRTKQGKALYTAFLLAKGTRDEISEKDFAQIEAMAATVRRQQCLNLIAGGRAEVSIVWRDPKTDVLCKRRLDYERPVGFNHCITDLKSSADIGAWSFASDIAKYGYALAAAFSIDGWLVLTGEPSTYCLLAVEKDYHVAKVWEPDEDTIDAGREHYRKALATTAECLKTGAWPAYGDEAEYISAPRWYLDLHGAGPDLIRPEPAYTGGGTPEGQQPDEFDAFLKGDT